MKKAIFAGLLILILAYSSGIPTRQPDKSLWVESRFGMMLVHGANSSPVTFAILGYNNNEIVRKTPITQRQFVLMASGEMYSLAHPDTVNLFEKYGITVCTPEFDPATKQYYNTECPVISETWKLRFMRDPFHADERISSGWTKRPYAPSMRQMLMLKDSFGLSSFSDYVVGENIFRLLRALTDTTFVNEYKRRG